MSIDPIGFERKNMIIHAISTGIAKEDMKLTKDESVVWDFIQAEFELYKKYGMGLDMITDTRPPR